MTTILNFFAKNNEHSVQVSVSTDYAGNYDFLVIKNGKIYEKKTIPIYNYPLHRLPNLFAKGNRKKNANYNVMIYRSIYKENLGEYIKHELSEAEQGILNALFGGYKIEQLLQTDWFQLIRIGDNKYTMIVQKYVNDTWCVKFYKNKCYGKVV